MSFKDIKDKALDLANYVGFTRPYMSLGIVSDVDDDVFKCSHYLITKAAKMGTPKKDTKVMCISSKAMRRLCENESVYFFKAGKIRGSIDREGSWRENHYIQRKVKPSRRQIKQARQRGTLEEKKAPVRMGPEWWHNTVTLKPDVMLKDADDDILGISILAVYRFKSRIYCYYMAYSKKPFFELDPSASQAINSIKEVYCRFINASFGKIEVNNFANLLGSINNTILSIDTSRLTDRDCELVSDAIGKSKRKFEVDDADIAEVVTLFQQVEEESRAIVIPDDITTTDDIEPAQPTTDDIEPAQPTTDDIEPAQPATDNIESAQPTTDDRLSNDDVIINDYIDGIPDTDDNDTVKVKDHFWSEDTQKVMDRLKEIQANGPKPSIDPETLTDEQSTDGEMHFPQD